MTPQAQQQTSHSNIVAKFFINGNVPSSKNHKIWTGSMLVSSKATQKWRIESKVDWIKQQPAFKKAVEDLPFPLYIELKFYRYSRMKFDQINMAQAVFDEMQTQGWIIDDSASALTPYFAEHEHAPNNPGVLITVLKQKPEHYDLPPHTS